MRQHSARRHAEGAVWAQALVTKYQKRISGPLLDWIDIHIEVRRVDNEKLSGDRVGEPSEYIRARVQSSQVDDEPVSNRQTTAHISGIQVSFCRIWQIRKSTDAKKTHAG